MIVREERGIALETGYVRQLKKFKLKQPSTIYNKFIGAISVAGFRESHARGWGSANGEGDKRDI